MHQFRADEICSNIDTKVLQACHAREPLQIIVHEGEGHMLDIRKPRCKPLHVVNVAGDIIFRHAAFKMLQ